MLNKYFIDCSLNICLEAITLLQQIPTLNFSGENVVKAL